MFYLKQYKEDNTMSIFDVDQMIEKEPDSFIFMDMFMDLKRAHDNNWDYFNVYYKKGFRFDVERRADIYGLYDCGFVTVKFYFPDRGSVQFNFTDFKSNGKDLTPILFYEGILENLFPKYRQMF
jgi:hypothetical protein